MKGNVFIVSAAFMATMMLSMAVAPAMAAPVKQYHVRVLDASGNPVVGVWVCLDGYNKSGFGGFLKWAETDEFGDAFFPKEGHYQMMSVGYNPSSMDTKGDGTPNAYLLQGVRASMKLVEVRIPP
jgi:hypothetical protein